MIKKIKGVINYNKLLKKGFGVFYYLYFGFLFLIIGSLIISLGDLKIGNAFCNFFRITGFIVGLFGGYYFLRFFILDREKWLPSVPPIIKGVILFPLGAMLWSLAEKEIFPVFKLFYMIAGTILAMAGLLQIVGSLMMGKMLPLFLSFHILSSLVGKLIEKPLRKFKNRPFLVIFLLLVVYIIILFVSLSIFYLFLSLIF